LGLFAGRFFNLNTALGVAKVNTFLDISLSLLDFLALAVLAFEIWKHWSIKLVGFLSAVVVINAFGFWLSGNSTVLTLSDWIFGLTRYLLLGFLVYHSWKQNKWLLIPLGIASLFDHLLVTQSVSLIVVWLVLNLKSLSVKYQTLALQTGALYLFVNVVTALYHVVSGQSLGLLWLGEPVLGLDKTSVAKQELGSFLLLRGYGLTQHPNILGFIGAVFAIVSMLQRSSMTKQLFALLLGLSLSLVILSFSRLAFLTLLVFGIWYLMATKVTLSVVHWAWKVACGLGILVLLSLFLTRLSVDLYRLEDLQQWWQAYSTSSWLQKIVGLGAGQYPAYLQQNFPQLAPWQWQPVHSVWLNLISEGGILNILLINLLILLSLLNRGKVKRSIS
jgi:hypothetical protein